MIRPARKEDSKEAVKLIYDAILDIAHALTGEETKEDALKVMEQFFVAEGNRLSYENCLIEEWNLKPVGIVIAYHGKDADRLDAPIRDHLQKKTGHPAVIDKEADESDYYIDTLSVHPYFRNKKIGTRLLLAEMQKGKELGFPAVSLAVDVDNKKAKKLYRKLNFRYIKTIEIQNHPYEYLGRII